MIETPLCRALACTHCRPKVSETRLSGWPEETCGHIAARSETCRHREEHVYVQEPVIRATSPLAAGLPTPHSLPTEGLRNATQRLAGGDLRSHSGEVGDLRRAGAGILIEIG